MNGRAAGSVRDVSGRLKRLSPGSKRALRKRVTSRERYVADTIRPKLASYHVLSPRTLNALGLHLSDVYSSCTDYIRHLDKIIATKSPSRTLEALVRLEVEVDHISKHIRGLRRLLCGAVDLFSTEYGSGVQATDVMASQDRAKGLVKLLKEKLVPDIIIEDTRGRGGSISETRRRAEG